MSYAGGMSLPAGDAQLVQIMDAMLAEASRKAGAWLACRPGCTQCCHGAFAINALDKERLRAAMLELDPVVANEVRARALAWIDEFGPDYPGNVRTGTLGTSEEEQARFEEFADDAPCPALNPVTGLCDVYSSRPMTCRVFGPPVRMAEGDALGCCELCFVGASEAEIAACEMSIPHEMEADLLGQCGESGQTVVAFALVS